ncbi:DUF262 domain-containing protein [Paenibacillus sp. WC2504]|uniref:DUF262 domain-containing protein n=1 Tax=Paenibacillus sp. WC2504 TaxID=3461403 RepID=UPI00404535C9
MNNSFNNLPFINMDRGQYTLFDLVNRFKRGDIELQPVYQRGEVWNIETKSHLIESILMNFPIPPLYFAERERGKWEVIDGQQRLRAIIDFIEGKFGLRKGSITGLEGVFFSQLEVSQQRKVQEYPFFVNILKKSSDSSIKFEIFQRINTTSINLTGYEIAFSKLGDKRLWLKELSTVKEFLNLTEKYIQPNGYIAEEMILRFLAFYFLGYKQYKGKMNSFINQFVDSNTINKLSYHQIREIFQTTMYNLLQVFGENAFCKSNYIAKINMALFDILTYSFARCIKNEISNGEQINNHLLFLLNNDNEFQFSLKKNTSNKKMVLYRFETWMKFMNSIYSNDDGGSL